MPRFGQFACGIALLALWSSAAGAHAIPWRDGESRVKGFGHCAKGPCTKRTDWSSSKPHHHHGNRIVLGSNRHTSDCPSTFRTDSDHRHM